MLGTFLCIQDFLKGERHQLSSTDTTRPWGPENRKRQLICLASSLTSMGLSFPTGQRKEGARERAAKPPVILETLQKLPTLQIS